MAHISTQKRDKPRILGWSKFQRGRRWWYRYYAIQPVTTNILLRRERLFTWHELYLSSIGIDAFMAEIEQDVAREFELALTED